MALAAGAASPGLAGEVMAAVAAGEGRDSGGAPDRVLVVVELTGGNDGLNTLVPFGASVYYKARPRLAVPEAEVLVLDRGRGLGLHPALAPLRDMVGEGLAAIVPGVGHSAPTRSHFISMDEWHRGTLVGAGTPTGWVGRGLDALVSNAVGERPSGCLCIGDRTPLLAAAARVQPVGFRDGRGFRWLAEELEPELGRCYRRLAALPVETDDGAADCPLDFVQRVAAGATDASRRVRDAVSRESETVFPRGPLADQLKLVAAMVRSGLTTRVYSVSLGGFDTHSDQLARHPARLAELARSVRAFYKELAATGHQSRVLTLAFSEFGRRVAENGTGGTDHGTAGPVFLFGPMVRPGVVGDHPDLERLDPDDLIYTADFRAVYAELLEGWLGVDSAPVLAGRFGPLALIQDSYRHAKG